MTALALYALLALGVTWPLGRHIATHVTLANVGAFGDTWAVAWTLAHESRVLAGLPHGGIYHPSAHSLYYGEAAFGALPLFIGPYLVTGNPILGLNVAFLGGIVLTAWSLHTVVRRWTGSPLAGFVSGWTFLACPFAVWAWGPSVVSMVALWYWPSIVRRAATALDSARGALSLAALVFLQSLSSVYVAASLLPPLVALAAVRLARRTTRRAGWHLVLAAGVGALGWALVFAPYLLLRGTEPNIAQQTLYPFSLLSRLAGPSRLFAAGEPSGVAPVALVVIGLGAIPAATGAARHRTAWRSGLLWTAVGIVLSLPPRLVVLGHTASSPTGWLVAAGIPVQVVRDDGRRGLAALVGLCMLAGVAYAECAERLARRWMRCVLALLVALGVFQGLLRPVARRTSPAPAPGCYTLFAARASHRIDSPLMALLRRPGGPLLELPTAPGPIPHAEAMHRAAWHGRAILNGFQGYWPATFPASMALACKFPDPDAVAALRREAGLELVLVHLSAPRGGLPVGPYACPPRAMSAGTGAAPVDRPWDAAPWEAIARGGRPDLMLVARDGPDLLFRVGP